MKSPRVRVLFINDSDELARVLWPDEAFRLAGGYGFQVEIPKVKGPGPVDWASMAKGFDAFISSWGSPKVDGALLDAASGLKLLGHAAGSVNAVASEELFARGVKVATANPVMAEAVAEWSLMATLLASRKLQSYSSLFGLSPLRWHDGAKARDMRSMTIGIWGLGDISSKLLRLLRPLNPRRILVCSKHAAPEALEEFGAEAVSLETLLCESDAIHLLAAMTGENLGRIGARELGMIKDGATLINAGRARLTDEQELLSALSEKRFDAILDVYHKEPLDDGSPLLALDNVLLTPHNAGGPGRELYVPFILEEFDRFFKGETMKSEISLARYKTMTDEALARGQA